MGNFGTVEELISAARMAALREGLAEIVRIHLRLGPDTGMAGEELVSRMESLFHGPLLGRCAVTWEESFTGGISLASIEGYPPARAPRGP